MRRHTSSNTTKIAKVVLYQTLNYAMFEIVDWQCKRRENMFVVAQMQSPSKKLMKIVLIAILSSASVDLEVDFVEVSKRQLKYRNE